MNTPNDFPGTLRHATIGVVRLAPKASGIGDAKSTELWRPHGLHANKEKLHAGRIALSAIDQDGREGSLPFSHVPHMAYFRGPGSGVYDGTTVLLRHRKGGSPTRENYARVLGLAPGDNSALTAEVFWGTHPDHEELGDTFYLHAEHVGNAPLHTNTITDPTRLSVCGGALAAQVVAVEYIDPAITVQKYFPLPIRFGY